MANNLFISYDLYAPGQHYQRVIDAIKTLGPWAKLEKSLWYVNSASNAESAAKFLWQKMDANDVLIVIDSTNNDAYWYNMDSDVSKQLQEQWSR